MVQTHGQNQVFSTPKWYSYCSPVSNFIGRFYDQGVGTTSEN